MIVTKQQVVAALAQQRVNRPRALADQNIRSILRTYGGGANSIGELSPELYFHVFGIGVCADSAGTRAVGCDRRCTIGIARKNPLANGRRS